MDRFVRATPALCDFSKNKDSTPLQHFDIISYKDSSKKSLVRIGLYYFIWVRFSDVLLLIIINLIELFVDIPYLTKEIIKGIFIKTDIWVFFALLRLMAQVIIFGYGEGIVYYGFNVGFKIKRCFYRKI